MIETRRKCPSCDSGWFHADELSGGSVSADEGRLVPCPTCQGRGWVNEGSSDAASASAAA